ncbi:thioredoxin family protein [Bacillus horti]|uniref:Thiol-disulfide isomerase/thioredoxin n=1 Tax=Caldalkalibacillus horti TaxID=77523 RepID=A0ABT9VVU3_9BACI|nr:thioredoxin family protein [Bacillus horti]MDQ0165115.1 thiol-disulfide isomerase/thioredoxin [Bacillus horti]
MKKVIIFVGIIAVLFAGLYFVNESSNQSRIPEDNPYGTSRLSSSTIAQLNDPNYQNIILNEELDQKLEDGEDFFVYFFSPECEHCKRATPILVPIAEEMGVEIFKYNLLEFNEGRSKYDIQYTPTLVTYKNGEEVDRAVGAPEEGTAEFYEMFLTQYKD